MPRGAILSRPILKSQIFKSRFNHPRFKNPGFFTKDLDFCEIAPRENLGFRTFKNSKRPVRGFMSTRRVYSAKMLSLLSLLMSNNHNRILTHFSVQTRSVQVQVFRVYI